MLTNKVIVGKILIVAGFALFLIGTLFLGGATLFNQLVCMLGWVSGAVLFVAGLVLNFELFTVSKGGLGIALISISAVLMITALALFSLRVFSVTFIERKVEVFFHGEPVPNFFIWQTRPYEAVVGILAEVALFLFVAGLLLKLYDDIF